MLKQEKHLAHSLILPLLAFGTIREAIKSTAAKAYFRIRKCRYHIAVWEERTTNTISDAEAAITKEQLSSCGWRISYL